VKELARESEVMTKKIQDIGIEVMIKIDIRERQEIR
jgi:hypothetical protein